MELFIEQIISKGEEMQFIKADYVPEINPPLQKTGGLNEENGGLKEDNGGLKEDNGGINESHGGINGVLNGGLKSLLKIIKENPDKRTNQLSLIIGKPIKTVEKQIKKLVDMRLVKYCGSKKTGGYWVIEATEEKH